MSKPVVFGVAFLSVAVAATVCFGGEPAAMNDLPTDVVAFIGRRSNCEYWLSKFPRNTETIAALKCDTTTQDEAALRQRYNTDPRVISALNAHWKKIVVRVPVQVDQ